MSSINASTLRSPLCHPPLRIGAVLLSTLLCDLPSAVVHAVNSNVEGFFGFPVLSSLFEYPRTAYTIS